MEEPGPALALAKEPPLPNRAHGRHQTPSHVLLDGKGTKLVTTRPQRDPVASWATPALATRSSQRHQGLGIP